MKIMSTKWLCLLWFMWHTLLPSLRRLCWEDCRELRDLRPHSKEPCPLWIQLEMLICIKVKCSKGLFIVSLYFLWHPYMSPSDTNVTSASFRWSGFPIALCWGIFTVVCIFVSHATTRWGMISFKLCVDGICKNACPSVRAWWMCELRHG